MDHLDSLEHRSVFLFREAYANFKSLAMLWSIGKDSTVMLWRARKAFFGHVPFPLVHIDTSFKIPEMIAYRDRLAAEWNLHLIYGQHQTALAERRTFPDGSVDRLTCCALLKTEALKKTLSGEWPRYRFNPATRSYDVDTNREPFTGIVAGVRADEEGSRSKERYFSPRTAQNVWQIGDQPPEFWNQYNTDFARGTHVRIHPLLDWTELNIWEYIERERIPTVSLYYSQGDGLRYRSLGCHPCTFPGESDARTPREIIEELSTGKFAKRRRAVRASPGQRRGRRPRDAPPRRVHVTHGGGSKGEPPYEEPMTNALRRRIRAQFFRTLERAFDTDDGRQIAVDALNGLLAWRPRLPVASQPSPYLDLGRADNPAPDYSGTVFITARFRTGSTLLWNLFRHVEDAVAYYEPFNERRWFDPAARGTRIDRTHRGVDDYWREYEGLADLGEIYREAWVDRQLLMDESAWAPGMRRFVERLIDHAAPRRAVLQFNRVDFRLPWLRRQFPGASIVHLYRHPRDQWCSTFMTPPAVPRDVTMAAFEPLDHFYLTRWARDLRRHFPFLSDRGDASAYRTFYFIWKLSYLFGAAYADHALSFEELTSTPRQQIEALLSATGFSGDVEALARLVGTAPEGQWRQLGDDEWFRRHESACEAVLAEFFRGQREQGVRAVFHRNGLRGARAASDASSGTERAVSVENSSDP